MKRAPGPALLVLFLAACSRPEVPPPAAGSAPATPAAYRILEAIPDAGTIRGVVTLTGPVPRLQAHPVAQDQAACGRAPHASRALLLGAGNGVANAVVHLEGIGAGAGFPPAPVGLDQRSCEFEPYVQVAALGSAITLLNSDDANHNVHAYDEANTSLFNAGTPVKGMKVTQTLDRTGVIRLKCDVHPWMIGWVFVTDRPYAAVTDRDGRFTLRNVPPGTYRLAVWHELLGGAGATVTVAPKGEASASLTVGVGG